VTRHIRDIPDNYLQQECKKHEDLKRWLKKIRRGKALIGVTIQAEKYSF